MMAISLVARDIIQLLQEAGILLDYRMSNDEQVFAGYGTDSRAVEADQLFIAYRGVRFDAHDAIEHLKAQYPQMGFIVDSPASFQVIPADSFVCLVSDSREAWAWLAARRYGNPQQHLRIIGITGTNGKTSTVWYVRQLFRLIKIPILSMGTIGVYCGEEQFAATHTTPDPDELFRLLALGVDKGLRWAAMEVSSHAVVQRRIGPLRFDAAAFTSFSRDHLDFHSSMEEYFAAKWQIFTDYLKPKAVVYLSQNIRGRLENSEVPEHFRFYGRSGDDSLMRSQDARYTVQSMSLEATEVEIRQADQIWQGQLSFGADFAVANFTAAWLLLDSLMPGLAQVQDWALIQAVPGRFEPVAAGFVQKLAVIVDYAHTPDALEQTLRKLRELTQSQVWVVFGCGGDRDRGKRALMGAVAEREADFVVVTSDNPRSEDPEAILLDIAQGMQKAQQHHFIVDREAAIRLAIMQAKAGDTILIAGKGHEDYQLIGSQRIVFDDYRKAEQLLQERLASGIR